MKDLIAKIRNTHGIENLNSYQSGLGDDIQKLMSLAETEFDKGFVAACVITLKNHDQPTMVEDTFKANFMTIDEMKKKGIEKQDIETIRWVRRDVSPLSKVYFSGYKLSDSIASNSYFAMSSGHPYDQHGSEESIQDILVTSKAHIISLCGQYYGWRTRLDHKLDYLEIQFVHSARIVGLAPRQYFSTDLSALDDPRGIGYTGNLIPRSIEIQQNPANGFVSVFVLLSSFFIPLTSK